MHPHCPPQNDTEHQTTDPTGAADLLEAQTKATKTQFDAANEHLKDIHSGLNKYSKSLEKQFNREKPLPFAESDALAPHTNLINRAIVMHLLREGHFDVAANFVTEANAYSNVPSNAMDVVGPSSVEAGHMAMVNSLAQARGQGESKTARRPWEAEIAPAVVNKPVSLQQHFSEMYQILEALRQHQNLQPAINWARTHSAVLEARSSNLEYDLCRLQYIKTFMQEGPQAALSYARTRLSAFPSRYAQQTQELMGALAYIPNLLDSPYGKLFANSSADTTQAAAGAFTAEFCALLSLSSASPLLTAVTAGCIALPTLLKLSQIQQLHRTSWTTASELPVEVPLPPAYHFHSVFVCPVSKEQSTDQNPPMMMPCHHVICKESLERVSRGLRFKCPYCPAESHPSQAQRVFL